MPWNDNKGGGGGWTPGGGGRGPWGQGPNNGGGGRGQGPNIRPPDLDEVFKRGREWLKRMFPNQSPGGMLIALVGGALLLLWIATGFYQIQPAEQGIVLRFGQYVDTINSGLHVRLPPPLETVLRANVGARNQINIGFRPGADGRSTQTADLTPESMMLTGDANIMHVQFTISWQITNAQDFFFQVDDVEPTIRAVADSAMREAVGQSQVDLILTKDRAKIQEQVRSTMQAVLDSYRAGVTILAVALQDTKPPAPVVEAFNDQQASDTDRQRSINEAETYAGSIVPKARGDASKIVQDAEAFKTQAVTLAQGEAQRFKSIYQQYRSAPEVTRERLYVETMQRILSRSNKILIDGKGTSGVTPYLPLPELRRTQQPAEPRAATGGNAP
ncbi:MAG: FtsH protease activity modulator HflK [Alphaproteobacteria bacterium]|jgi:membrane protease subunit HflK|nr:FtsH protease activity modulator HflK [Alphaproteobacteria bacterium]